MCRRCAGRRHSNRHRTRAAWRCGCPGEAGRVRERHVPARPALGEPPARGAGRGHRHRQRAVAGEPARGGAAAASVGALAAGVPARLRRAAAAFAFAHAAVEPAVSAPQCGCLSARRDAWQRGFHQERAWAGDLRGHRANVRAAGGLVSAVLALWLLAVAPRQETAQRQARAGVGLRDRRLATGGDRDAGAGIEGRSSQSHGGRSRHVEPRRPLRLEPWQERRRSGRQGRTACRDWPRPGARFRRLPPLAPCRSPA